MQKTPIVDMRVRSDVSTPEAAASLATAHKSILGNVHEYDLAVDADAAKKDNAAAHYAYLGKLAEIQQEERRAAREAEERKVDQKYSLLSLIPLALLLGGMLWGSYRANAGSDQPSTGEKHG